MVSMVMYEPSALCEKQQKEMSANFGAIRGSSPYSRPHSAPRRSSTLSVPKESELGARQRPVEKLDRFQRAHTNEPSYLKIAGGEDQFKRLASAPQFLRKPSTEIKVCERGKLLELIKQHEEKELVLKTKLMSSPAESPRLNRLRSRESKNKEVAIINPGKMLLEGFVIAILTCLLLWAVSQR